MTSLQAIIIQSSSTAARPGGLTIRPHGKIDSSSAPSSSASFVAPPPPNRLLSQKLETIGHLEYLAAAASCSIACPPLLCTPPQPPYSWVLSLVNPPRLVVVALLPRLAASMSLYFFMPPPPLPPTWLLGHGVAPFAGLLVPDEAGTYFVSVSTPPAPQSCKPVGFAGGWFDDESITPDGELALINYHQSPPASPGIESTSRELHCAINTLGVSLPHPLNGLCGAFVSPLATSGSPVAAPVSPLATSGSPSTASGSPLGHPQDASMGL
ncbi:hypothetical protein B0H14DRAFT_3503328 [Mycena olivaceomarginata]|nr:hypothetical protein B0H14DRAFT_3503328 [Mycena olivaceomarginata]